MRRLMSVAVAGFIVTLTLVLAAAEKPTPEYTKAMKDLGGVVQAMTKPGANEDTAVIKKSAATAKESFAVVQKYWNSKNAPDATKLAEAGVKAAADLIVVSDFASPEGVDEAMKDMTATCGACHTAHREKLADGSFEIK